MAVARATLALREAVLAALAAVLGLASALTEPGAALALVLPPPREVLDFNEALAFAEALLTEGVGEGVPAALALALTLPPPPQPPPPAPTGEALPGTSDALESALGDMLCEDCTLALAIALVSEEGDAASEALVLPVASRPTPVEALGSCEGEAELEATVEGERSMLLLAVAEREPVMVEEEIWLALKIVVLLCMALAVGHREVLAKAVL